MEISMIMEFDGYLINLMYIGYREIIFLSFRSMRSILRKFQYWEHGITVYEDFNYDYTQKSSRSETIDLQIIIKKG